MNARTRLSDLPHHFQLIVIGGGITGAGIVAEAARRGLRALLVERHDFASGTSSWSSKLVHGGLRYLAGGHWRLTLESVRERNRLLRERAGLVELQPFLMPVYRDSRPGLRTLRTGLAVYDLMGGQWRSRALSARQALALEPGLRRDGLIGAVAYDDARTDDARLTLQLIFEAAAAGAQCLNYVAALALLRQGERVVGVRLRDAEDGSECEIGADVVINAVGATRDAFEGAAVGAPLLRPLRGSHLIFPLNKLPVRRAVSWLHPRDRRPVFVYPWLGVALCGTTDVDQAADLEPHISEAEADYLIEALAHQFPLAGLQLADAQASYAGVRPIVAGGGGDPSAESRESALWQAPGYVGITGGKLTTFRLTAQHVLRAAVAQSPALAEAERTAQPTHPETPSPATQCAAWIAAQPADERVSLGGTPYSCAALRWSARHEQVRHLDDLLMRRSRLSLLLPQGGAELLDDLASICQEELGWDAARWQQECAHYRQLWQRLHAIGE